MNCCDDWGQCTRGPGCPAGARGINPRAGVIHDRLPQGVSLPEPEPMRTSAPPLVPDPDDAWYALTRREVAHLLLGLLPFAGISLALVGWLIWSRWGSTLMHVARQWLG